MKTYKAILYDIDGTLLDTLQMNMIPLIRIIEEEFSIVYTFEEVLKYASMPGMQVMEALGVKHKEETYARWVHYVNTYEKGAALYEGIEEMLQHFQKCGLKQAVVSAKRRKQYEIDIVKKGLDHYMDACVLAEDTQHHKPHPQPLLECVQRLNLQVEDVLYIGDAPSDYEASLRAHIDFAYATWGSTSNAGIETPTFVFHQPKDILQQLMPKEQMSTCE